MKSVLIANRGEIACRVIRTAKNLGIKTVAIYSDADANALHVKLADEAIHIGLSPAAESYLVGEKIIEAAKVTGAEAIHPGYGFLSENAGFADAVIKAGLIWIGPQPSAIRDMGLKDAAKSLMIKAGVPTTPGYLGEDQSLEVLATEAEKIGYPVLIKAVAGGGGKGMRKVDVASDFQDALESCKREAKASFGDDNVLLEKWITDPRHIEVQVFGDTHGNVVHLFERDCTLQRRHQKVIEEAPAPGMDEATREAVCAAAVRAAKAVDYVGAGTVEFIADGSGALDADKIWFMEMNARLQVEHPVTEMITGVDLVEWQLRVASGDALPLVQEKLTISGWAMEARLYAENPESGFLPSIGKMDVLSLPDFVRVDTGVEQGGVVSPYYDPMISKLIAHGRSRDEARTQLADACNAVSTFPVANNAGFLSKLLREPDFSNGSVTTSYINDHLERLTSKPVPSRHALRAGARSLYLANKGSANAIDRVWRSLPGFRLSAPPDIEAHLEVDGERQVVEMLPSQTDYLVLPFRDGVVLIEDGWSFYITPPQHVEDTEAAAGSGSITSPMPGRVVSVDVKAGDQVSKGQKLVTLEAMKMEHALEAPFEGVVSELVVEVDAQLMEGAFIMQIEEASDE